MARRREAVATEPDHGEVSAVITGARTIVANGLPLTLDDHAALEAVADVDSWEYLVLTMVHMNDAQSRSWAAITFGGTTA